MFLRSCDQFFQTEINNYNKFSLLDRCSPFFPLRLSGMENSFQLINSEQVV